MPGRVAEDAEIVLALAGHRLDRQGVDVPDRRLVVQAVLQNVLSIEDGLDAVPGAQEDCAPRHFEQKAVAGGHGLQRVPELEILDQGAAIGRQLWTRSNSRSRPRANPT